MCLFVFIVYDTVRMCFYNLQLLIQVSISDMCAFVWQIEMKRKPHHDNGSILYCAAQLSGANYFMDSGDLT